MILLLLHCLSSLQDVFVIGGVVNLFSQSMSDLFTLIIAAFALRKLSSLMQFHLSVFACSPGIWSPLHEAIVQANVMDFLLFSSSSFTVFVSMLKPFIKLD
jgi:hypothetical protein